MARKRRNSKSSTPDSLSKKRSTGRTHARLGSSTRAKNRSKNQQPNLSGQKFSTRGKIAPYRALQVLRRAREKASRERSLALLSDLRHGEGSYSQLLRKHRLDTRTAHKYLGRNLLGGSRGQRVHASKTDRLVRYLLLPLSSGDVPTRIRGSNAATKLSEYFHDRDKLLRGKMTAEEFEAKWRGVHIAGQEVFADTAAIFLRAEAGDLKVENLYASAGGAE